MLLRKAYCSPFIWVAAAFVPNQRIYFATSCIVVSTISLQQAATRVGASFLMALAPSNEAPMESSASGVVRLERLGQGFLRQGRQAKGQQAVQRTQNNAVQNGVGQHTVQQLEGVTLPCCCGLSTVRIMTAKMLNSGTLPKIISGAMPEVP